VQPYETGRNDALAYADSRPEQFATLAQQQEYDRGYHDGFWEAD